MVTNCYRLPLQPDLLTHCKGQVFHPDLESLHLTTWRIQVTRKPSTRMLYSYKWNIYRDFITSRGLPLIPTTMGALFAFLHHLFRQHLSNSTLKVYLAAKVAHQPPGSETSLFRHSTLKAFLRRLQNIHPRLQNPTPHWSLQLVLQQLMCSPFESLENPSERLLSKLSSLLL